MHFYIILLRDGRLKIGDELLWINGRHLIGLSHGEAVELLSSASSSLSSSVVQLVIARDIVSYLHYVTVDEKRNN